MGLPWLSLWYNILFASADKITVTPITSIVQHAEGPTWSQSEEALFFVDTFTATAYRWNFANGETTCQKIGGDSVGVIIPIKGTKNKYIVAGDRKLFVLSWEPKTNNSGTLKEVSAVDNDKPANQFNDGKVDSLGRLWAGTLTRKPDLSVENYGGTLYSIKGVDIRHPKVQKTNISISNGIAWTKDNKIMYFIDSETRKVAAYDFNLHIGKIDNERIIFDLNDYPHLKGIPDGMTIDTEDNLWIALFGGHSVIKVNPRVKKLLFILDIPATYVTSATFGGPNLDILFVTTSRLKYGNSPPGDESLSGSVFAVRGTGSRGLPSNEFYM